jgi:pheromone shutdown protein TraB
MLDKVFPDVKRILIEMKEEDIFKSIMENKGKKMLVLVNQPHMEGIMHHWCHTYGQLPNNVRNVEIDPIGDMPLRRMLFSQMYHVIMRDVKSARFKATPASYSNDINPYWREFNFQYEHRNM